MMDITPQISPEVNVIKAYGKGFFDILDKKISGNIILSPSIMKPINSDIMLNEDKFFEEICSFQEKNLINNEALILLIGTGKDHVPISQKLFAKLNMRNIVADPMMTSAACRTYNILVSENRNVAAALLAI